MLLATLVPSAQPALSRMVSVKAISGRCRDTALDRPMAVPMAGLIPAHAHGSFTAPCPPPPLLALPPHRRPENWRLRDWPRSGHEHERQPGWTNQRTDRRLTACCICRGMSTLPVCFGEPRTDPLLRRHTPLRTHGSTIMNGGPGDALGVCLKCPTHPSTCWPTLGLGKRPSD